MNAVENAPVERDDLARRHRADAELGELLLDLAAQVAVHRRARLDRQECAEIADRDAMQGLQAHGAGAQIVEGAPGRGLDERIGPCLEVEKGVERIVDQRVGETLELEDRAFGKIDVEQPQQRLMDMGEHVGGGDQLPAIAPAIVDGEEGLFFLDPGGERKKIGIAVALDAAAQPRQRHARLIAGHGRAPASFWPSSGRSLTCSSTFARDAGETERAGSSPTTHCGRSTSE